MAIHNKLCNHGLCDFMGIFINISKWVSIITSWKISILTLESQRSGSIGGRRPMPKGKARGIGYYLGVYAALQVIADGLRLERRDRRLNPLAEE